MTDDDLRILKMSQDTALLKLEEQYKKGFSLMLDLSAAGAQALHAVQADYLRWHRFNRSLLRRMFKDPAISAELQRHGAPYNMPEESWRKDVILKAIHGDVQHLLALHDQVRGELFPEAADLEAAPPAPMERLECILTRFHAVAEQLKVRHENQDTLVVKNEYDVQDLLHALLLIDFEDVRREENTPSHAARSGRMDFLLRNEQIGIETKMTRDGLEDKEVGDQLIKAIVRYRKHEDCRSLVCFVYDPGSRIRNRNSLIRDLESEGTEAKSVRVLVLP